MRNNYEISRILVYISDLKYSFEEGFPRKKKSNKLMEKKSRRSQHCFGHNRVCRASIEIRSRKKGRKINYESKSGYIDFHENILEDVFNVSPQTQIPLEEEFMEIMNTRTTKIMFSQYELMGDFCIDMLEELVIEILSRLPYKTLARFKCVSKLWRRLISNDVPVRNAPKLFILDLSIKEEALFYSVDNEALVKSFVNTPIKEHLLQNHVVKAHSSCHGLLLIQIDEDLFVWNPLTNFFTKVLTIEEFDYRNYQCRFEANLCYCSTNKKYKVVLVVNRLSKYPDTQDFYVATFGAKSWKKLENVNFDKMIKGPFFKGYRHWRCSKGKQVVYFDTSTNNFIEIAMPQQGNRFLQLGVFDECLCITRWDGPEWREEKLEFVVMKEYGNGNSWEVTFVISTIRSRYYNTLVPLFRTKEGEVVVGVYKDCDCCYNVEAYDVHGTFLRQIKCWSTGGSLIGYDNFNAILYEESSGVHQQYENFVFPQT